MDLEPTYMNRKGMAKIGRVVKITATAWADQVLFAKVGLGRSVKSDGE